MRGTINRSLLNGGEREIPLVALLYAVQFAPLSFFLIALPVVLRSRDYSMEAIGWMQAAFLPFALKFLWAPLIDRYGWGRAHYRNWIYVTTASHITAIVALALFEPLDAPVLLFALLAAAAATVSTQDIAVDALVTMLVPPDRRGIANGIQAAGGYLGGLVGGGLFLPVFETFGWGGALTALAMTAATAPIALWCFAPPEPTAADGPRASPRDLVTFFRRPGIARWVAILAVYRLPLMMCVMPLQTLLIDQGGTLSEAGLWMGVYGMAAGVAGGGAAGVAARSLSRAATLRLFHMLAAVGTVGVFATATFAPGAAKFAIPGLWFAMAFCDTALYARAMDVGRPGRAAGDFAIQIALIFFVNAVTEPLWGRLADSYGRPVLLAVAVFLAFGAHLLVRRYARTMESESAIPSNRSIA